MTGRPGRGRADHSAARVWIVWLAFNVAGIALVVADDGHDRVVSLSESHGPSAIEAVGVVLIVAGWVALDIRSWRRRTRSRWSRARRWSAAVVAAAGAATVVPTIVLDLGAWWIVAATPPALVQLAFAWSGPSAISPPRSDRMAETH